MSATEGQPAPALDLPTDGGGRITLAALKGKPAVVYFYPKDDTTGCTREAQDFTALAPDFAALDATVIGVSRDTVKKHDRFKAKYDLAVILASDEDGAACEAWGVWVQKKLYGREYMGIERATFLIDPEGVIRAMVYYPMSNGRSVDEFVRLLTALQTSDANKVATPENWQPGEPVIVPPPATAEAAKARKDEGYDYTDWYFSKKTL